jgi:hypothetical protein
MGSVKRRAREGSDAAEVAGSTPGYVKDICVADLDVDGRPDVVMRQDSETQLYFQEKASWTTVTIAHPPHEGTEALHELLTDVLGATCRCKSRQRW